jgi:hypothetical protein
MNTDPIRRFELSYLRPLWGMMIFLMVAAAVCSRWWWAVGGAFSILYVGVIGAKLHPSLSAAQLSQGPLTSTAAIAESSEMDRVEKAAIVKRACHRVAYLLTAWSTACFLFVFGWRWYVAIPAAIFVSALIGGLLIVAFEERSRH